LIVALAGNQNCGKTTLFNRLTGARQHVGNWPGVTVEAARGQFLPKWRRGSAQPVQIVDLPGVYSLAPFSEDEAVTRRCLAQHPPDVILNVVDALHLERNLYLTLQLLELHIPMVVALTMVDSLTAHGGHADAAALTAKLGVPVVPLYPGDDRGLRQLCTALAAADAPPPKFSLGGEVGKAQQSLLNLGLLPEGSTVSGIMEAHWELLPEHPAQPILRRLEAATGLPPQIALARERHRSIEKLLSGCYTPGQSHAAQLRADRLLVDSYLALPVFIGIMALVFFLAFGPVGASLSQCLQALPELLGGIMEPHLPAQRVFPWLRAFLLEALLPGLGSVLSFLPPLLILLLLLDLLEDSGYLTRAAFLLDRPLRRIGLSGRSLLPMVLGFGCTVPAVLCARGIKSSRERRLAVLLTPLMSCSARIPVYSALAQSFFPSKAAFVVLCLYLAGIASAVLLGLLSDRRSHEAAPFLLELPPLRVPSLGNALRQTLHRLGEFLCRMLSLITLATTAVWLLRSLTPQLSEAPSPEESILGQLAGAVAPLLAPCGFGTPAAAAALLTGLLAKEGILSTLAVLAGDGGSIGSLFASPLAAFSFLLFTLLYTPCMAAMSTIRRELGSPRLACLAAAGYALLAWMASALVYQLGCLFGCP